MNRDAVRPVLLGVTPRLRPSRIAPPSAVLVLALGLVACGGTDAASEAATTTDEVRTTPSDAAASAPPAGEQQGEAVTVTAVEFELRGDGDGVRAGEVELTLVNDGSSSHDLVVERDGEEVAAVPAVGPGSSSSATVALEPGEYVVYCSVANHRAMGMETTIEVT